MALSRPESRDPTKEKVRCRMWLLRSDVFFLYSMASSFRQKAALSNNVNQAPQASDQLTLSVPVNTAQREGEGREGWYRKRGRGGQSEELGGGGGRESKWGEGGGWGAGRERDGGGGGGGRGRRVLLSGTSQNNKRWDGTLHLTQHCHHWNDFCTGLGSDTFYWHSIAESTAYHRQRRLTLTFEDKDELLLKFKSRANVQIWTERCFCKGWKFSSSMWLSSNLKQET